MKKLSKKLSLNRETIANLNPDEMKNSLAGADPGVQGEPTIVDRTCPIHCPKIGNIRLYGFQTYFIFCQLSIFPFC